MLGVTLLPFQGLSQGRAEEPATTPADDDAFVSVDPATRTSVSGKSLAIASYTCILGLLLVHAFSLHRREKTLAAQTNATVRALEKALEESLKP